MNDPGQRQLQPSTLRMMSDDPYYLLKLPLRADLDEATMTALRAFAEGRTPPEDVLARLNPTVVELLRDPGVLNPGDPATAFGTSARLATDLYGDWVLTVEFCMEGDWFLSYAYVWWLWLMSLVRGKEDDGVEYLGITGYAPFQEAELVTLSKAGIHEGETVHTHEEIAEALANWGGGD